jgi:hypothetical protein
MIPSLTTLVARRSTLGLALACILVLSVTPAHAIKMARIAQFNERLNWNFPCGCANRTTGHYGIYGTESYPRDSLVVYEYEGNNQFQRIVPGPVIGNGVWDFGDGDNDSRMELLAGTANNNIEILESRSPDSFPTDSVWSAQVPSMYFPYPRYVNLDCDGRQEIAFCVYDHICLCENSGNNRYDSVAVLRDSVVQHAYAPLLGFDVGEFDRDSVMELVAGTDFNWIDVFRTTDSTPILVARCSTSTYRNTDVAAANDMDHDGWPKFIAFGADSVADDPKLMVFEASVSGGYHCVWQELRPDFAQGFYNNPISVGDVDRDSSEEFAVSTGKGSIALFKCTGLHSYSQVWTFESTGTYVRLFDINQDSRAEIIFDGPQGTEILEDTEGLGVAEFTKLPQLHTVTIQPTIARLGASLLFSGLPPGADIEVLSLDGRLVSRTQGVRQSTWTWNLRSQSGSLVPAGTYFAVIRSKGKSTSLKLCLVK